MNLLYLLLTLFFTHLTRDLSCYFQQPDGGLVANAPHLPVHLGAMQDAVRFQIKHLGTSLPSVLTSVFHFFLSCNYLSDVNEFNWHYLDIGDDWKEGEVIVSNHPAAGGSHLPDITVITPVRLFRCRALGLNPTVSNK